MPKLDSSSGKAQAKAILDALHDWNLDQVQIMCCDTTASNTGHLNGACILLVQRLERELLLFAHRHHIYELVLKSVFEAKIQQVLTAPISSYLKSSEIIGATLILLTYKYT